MDLSLTSILSRVIPLPENIIVYILKQVITGICFIHAQYRIHRDIKSDNVLLDFKGKIKICDLGFAAQLTSEQQSRSTLAGTPCWVAPDIFSLKPYGREVDIWSFGILAIELVDSEPPMIRANIERIIENTLNSRVGLKNPNQVSPRLLQLINKCLTPDPAERISASEILMDPIFNHTVSQEQFTSFLMERYKLMV